MSDFELPELNDAMFQLGSALIVATVAPDGEPRAARASSWRLVDAASRRLRLAIAANDPVIVDNLTRDGSDGPGTSLAVTGADVATLRSVQVKGRVVTVEPPEDADLELIEQHADVFTRKIQATDGHPREVVLRFLPTEYVMVEMLVDEAYDQTPGPAAGAVLREQWT